MSAAVDTTAAEEGDLDAESFPALRLPSHRLVRRLLQQVLTAVVVLAILIGVWAAIDKIFRLPTVELPTPTRVWMALHGYFGLLMHNAAPTVIEGVCGYAIAAGLGIPIGYLLSRPGKLSTALKTAVLSAQIFPKVAIAPLLIVWFGFGYLPKFLFVFLLGFFPIAINSAAGFSSMPLELGDLGQIVGFGPLRRIRRLQGPWALPQIFTGLKISASFAIIAALVYEFVGAQSGLGVLIVQTQSNLNVPLMFAALVVVGVLGFLFYGLIVLLEMVAIPWHVSRRRPS